LKFIFQAGGEFQYKSKTCSAENHADGVGFSRSISMKSLLPLISTVIAMWRSPLFEEKHPESILETDFPWTPAQTQKPPSA
jgi:hypothetical protein